MKESAMADEFQNLWSSLPSGPQVTAGALRARARQIVARRRRRALFAAGCGLLSLAVPVTVLVRQARELQAWEWVGIGYLLAGALLLLWLSLGQSRRVNFEMDTAESVRRYRAMLELERKASHPRMLAMHALIPVFFLLLHLVSVVSGLLVVGTATTVLLAAGLLAMSGFFWHRGRRRARLIDSCIEELDRGVSA
jgi:hypothetical protein